MQMETNTTWGLGISSLIQRFTDELRDSLCCIHVCQTSLITKKQTPHTEIQAYSNSHVVFMLPVAVPS